MFPCSLEPLYDPQNLSTRKEKANAGHLDSKITILRNDKEDEMANLLKQYFKNEISLTMTLTENIKMTITNDNNMVKSIN